MLTLNTITNHGTCIHSITPPLFSKEKRVLVLDVDGVLVKQIPTYFNGSRGGDTYIVAPSAKRVITKAERRVDHVVLWTHLPNYIAFFKGKLFKKIPFQLFGFDTDSPDGRDTYKDLRKISNNPLNIVGVEDDDMFYPRERAVKIYRGRGIIHALEEALDKF